MADALSIASFGYHEVTDNPGESGFQRASAAPYKLARARFADHLAVIATAPVAPELVTDVDLSGGGRHVLLTFDDGGKSALYVSDELCRYGWRGHFFIITSFVGQRTFLDAAGVRQLHASGHLVGSHSHTHPTPFKAQNPSRMLAEWRESRDRLSQLLGEPCITASVPGGDISPAVLESADAAGLQFLFTSEPRLEPEKVGSCWVLGRFIPKTGTSTARMRGLVRFGGWGRAMLVRRLKLLTH